MPIRKTNFDSTRVFNPEQVEYFYGRVLKVETAYEDRNWSDTLDYSDWRTTKCTYALVWLGERGVPPLTPSNVTRSSSGSGLNFCVPRSITYIEPCSWQVERDLTEDEQFAWIDCTNIFADRTFYSLTPEADPYPTQVAVCGPDVMERYYAWEERRAAEAVRLEKERQMNEIAAAEKKRRAEEKAEAELAAAEGLLSKVPKKGSTVTVDDFTGQVFWSGMKKYRGKWSVRAGLKDKAGNVRWVDAANF